LAVVDNVFARIEAAPEALARRMADAITAEIPNYKRAQSERLLDDLYDQCLRHARLLPEVLRTRRMPTRDEFAFAREAAGRRVHSGIPLDAFLHAFRVTHGVMWEALAADAEAEHALPLVGLLIEYFDIASTQVAEAYVREEQRIHELADRQRRDLLENLLLGRLPEEDGVHPAAPGIDPTGQLMLVLAQADDLPRVARTLAATLCRPLVVTRQAEVVALVSAGERVRADLDAARERCTFVAGLSSPLSGFAGVRRGYLEAEHAVQQATPARPVVAVAEIPAFDYLLMSADTAARAVIAAKGAALAELAPAERETIAATVNAYVAEDLSVARTARRLQLHPNTVRYRLDRIAELTGRDPRRLSDTIELLCVLRVVQAR
jgi:PucR-like helix-turn-helix protein/diguanylate cyclase with GGDEF domain